MKKKKIAVLVCSVAVISLLTFLAGLCKDIDILWLKLVLMAAGNLSIAGVSLIAMKLTGMKPDFDIKNGKQYLIGVVIALVLSLTIAVLPAVTGFSLVGGHNDFSWFNVIYHGLNYMLIIGPVEELTFRVYIQDTMMSFFDRHKYAGVVLASLLFGVWHWINGSVVQVMFTFGIGLVFGSCKYFIKDLNYPGLALGHGLYDYLNEFVRMFIV